MGSVALQREPLQGFSSLQELPQPSTLWRHSKKAPPMNQKVETDLGDALTLDF